METPHSEFPEQDPRADDDHTLEDLVAITGLFSPSALVEELRHLEELEKDDDAAAPDPEVPPEPASA